MTIKLCVAYSAYNIQYIYINVRRNKIVALKYKVL